MIVYYISGVVAVIFARLSEKARPPQGSPNLVARPNPHWMARFWAILCVVVLIGVGALRWKVGTDYGDYARSYPERVRQQLSELHVLDEPGLTLIAKAGASVWNDYAMMLGLASALTIGLFVWGLYRNSVSFTLSVTFFIVTGPWVGSFNGVRQYLACAVIFAGHHLILERKFLKYAAVIFLATLFHISALIAILFYLVPRRKLTLLTSVLVIGSALLASRFYAELFAFAASLRPENEAVTDYFTRSIDPLRIAVALAPIVLYLLVTKKSDLKPKDHFYVHMMLINAAVFIASFGSAYVARFALYTLIFVAVGFPSLLPREQGKGMRALIVSTCVILYTIYWFVEVSGDPTTAHYNSIFQRDSSLNK